MRKSKKLIVELIAGLESRVLIAIFLIAGGIWGFVELADEILEGETHFLDRKLLLMLRDTTDLSDPVGPFWFEEFVRDLTSLGSISVLGILCLAVVVYLLMEGKKGMSLMIVLSVGGGLLLSFALKAGFDRPRPDIVPYTSHVMTASFPSGHSMLSAVTFLTLGGLLARYAKKRRIKTFVLGLAFLLTLLVGFSRVYLGVHWPTDVLAGWTAGATWAFICWVVALQLERRGRIEGRQET